MASYQHREQIAFDALDTATGEVSRGRIRPADRLGFRRWLGRWEGERIEAALEATTGWRFMVEELQAVGAEVHPAETSALRGPKKRAKTDRQDARRLRELLIAFVGVLVSVSLVRGRDLRLPKPVVAEPALEEAA
jgi:transposase